MPIPVTGIALFLLAQLPNWDGKTVVLARPGVELRLNPGEQIAPRTAGPAKDIVFQVRQDKDGRLQVESRRQRGWIAKTDAVVLDQTAAFFTDKLSRDAKDAFALTARGEVL